MLVSNPRKLWNAIPSGTAVFDPEYVMGLAFSFLGDDGDRNVGKLTVDDISFLLGTPIPAAETAVEPAEPVAVEEEPAPEQPATAETTAPIETNAVEEGAETSSSVIFLAVMSIGLIALLVIILIAIDKRRKGKQ